MWAGTQGPVNTVLMWQSYDNLISTIIIYKFVPIVHSCANVITRVCPTLGHYSKGIKCKQLCLYVPYFILKVTNVSGIFLSFSSSLTQLSEYQTGGRITASGSEQSLQPEQITTTNDKNWMASQSEQQTLDQQQRWERKQLFLLHYN